MTNAGRVRRTPDSDGKTRDRRKLATFLNLILSAAFVAAVSIPAMTSDAPAGHWWGMDQVDRAAQPKNIPTWETHGQPGFRDIATLEAAGVIPGSLLVVLHDGSTVVMTLDEVFERNENDNPNDDAWTVGWARRNRRADDDDDQ